MKKDFKQCLILLIVSIFVAFTVSFGYSVYQNYQREKKINEVKNLFNFGGTNEDKKEELWNMACDIHVEYVLDSLDVDLLKRPAGEYRENTFQSLEEKIKTLSAERIYQYLEEADLDYDAWERLEREFYKDDHVFWKVIDRKDAPGQEGEGDSDGAPLPLPEDFTPNESSSQNSKPSEDSSAQNGASSEGESKEEKNQEAGNQEPENRGSENQGAENQGVENQESKNQESKSSGEGSEGEGNTGEGNSGEDSQSSETPHTCSANLPAL